MSGRAKMDISGLVFNESFSLTSGEKADIHMLQGVYNALFNVHFSQNLLLGYGGLFNFPIYGDKAIPITFF